MQPAYRFYGDVVERVQIIAPVKQGFACK